MIDTSAVAMPPLPSDIRYPKLSEPAYAKLGVYVMVLFGFILTVPCPGWTVIELTVSTSPSGSESFARTFIVTAVFSVVCAESFAALGGLFGGGALGVVADAVFDSRLVPTEFIAKTRYA